MEMFPGHHKVIERNISVACEYGKEKEELIINGNGQFRTYW